jgi:hypothetical protein
MQGPRKRSGGKLADVTGAEHGALGAVKDAQSSRMLRMGKSLGNDEIQKRLDAGNATRDELLLYMSKRLGAMREAQGREEQFGNEKMRTAWKEISNEQKRDVTKPEPTRYNEAAKIYEEAAYQLCRGALGRGSELMKRAMEVERQAFEGVGKQIGVKDLDPGSKEECRALDDVKPNQGCGPCDVPDKIDKLADEIQRNTTEFADQPVKARAKDPWWTLEEEEEEEGAPADGGG